MFGFGFPTTYFSPVNYDMSNGNMWSSMNLHMNQCWEDMIARQSLYQVPMYNFGGFTNYGTNFGNSYLLDPMWTIGQAQVASMANGGQGIFAGMQFPWMNGSSSSSSSSKTDADKEKEARMKEEYNDLKELLNTYKNTATNISKSLQSKIETALKKSGKIEEKLAALEDAYNAIPEKSLRKTMALLDSKNTGYRQELEAAGYKFGTSEYSYKNTNDTEINKTVNAIHSEISSLSGKEYNAEEYLGAIEGNDILRLISYWNDKYNSTNERSIINLVVKKLPSNGHDREDAFNANVVPLVDALTDKASDVAGATCFDDETLENLDKCINELVKAKEKGVTNTTNIVKSFEKLYVMLRQMEAMRINSDIQNRYEFLNDISEDDKDFIDEDIIVEETKADLKAEGLESVSTDIEDDITVVDADDTEEVDESEDSEEANNGGGATKVSAEEEVKDLVNDGVITETSVEYNGAKVYVEAQKTGERDYKRVFIIQDGEIKELGNAKISGGVLCYVDPDNQTVTPKSITADSIEDAYEETVEKAENAEKAKKADAEARNNGGYVWKLLNGHTSKGDSRIIEDKLGGVNESNILAFLEGAYTQAGWHIEGLMEKLDDDTSVSISTKRNIIDSVLAKAEDLGLETSENYLELKRLMYEHDIAKPNAKGYDQFYNINWWGVELYKNYNERIDKAMEKLYKEMKAKAAQA